MSIEYTIDVQLTELGFPDILQTPDLSVRYSSYDSPKLPSIPLSNKEKLLGTDQPAAKLPSASGPEKEALASDVLLNPKTSEVIDLVSDEEEEQEDESDTDDSDVPGIYEEEDEDEAEEELHDSNHSDCHSCKVCGLKLPSKFKLQDHMNLHTGARPYCCAECGKRFCQNYNYQVHLRTHSTQIQKPNQLQCRICLLNFPSQAKLKHHLSFAHPEKEFYECDLCKRVFTCLKVCEEHIRTHRKLNCEVCGRTFSCSKSLESHLKKKCHSAYKCTDCNQTFTKKNALLKHSFSHLGLLPYTCIRCRRHFRLAKLYRFHTCLPHRVHCMACLREFFNKEDYLQHKKDTGCWGNQEAKVDKVRCLECGQRFDSTEELKKHAGAHQRVLKCAVCGKGFRSALLLMSHMGGHAGTSPCLCQTCGLGFPYQHNYDSHLKTCEHTSKPVNAPEKQQPSERSASEVQSSKKNPASVKPKATVAKPGVTKPAVTKPTAAKTAAVKPTTTLNKPDPGAGVVSTSSAPATVACKSVARKADARQGVGVVSTSTAPAAVASKRAPADDSVRSSPVAAASTATASVPSEGTWKLSVDKALPPCMNIVLFLPVCPTENNGPLPLAVSQTPPNQQLALAHQPTPGDVSLGVPLIVPLDLVTGMRPEPEREEPLDLSKKSCDSTPRDVPPLPVKMEPLDSEILVSADAPVHEFNIKNEADICHDAKRMKMDLSTSSTVAIKEEPQ